MLTETTNTMRQVAGMRRCGGMAVAAMGRASMAAPMPLMPLMRPARNQAKANTQAEGSKGMAYLCCLESGYQKGRDPRRGSGLCQVQKGTIFRLVPADKAERHLREVRDDEQYE